MPSCIRRASQGTGTFARVPLAYAATIFTGVPTRTSLRNARTSLLRRRTQPDTAWPVMARSCRGHRRPRPPGFGVAARLECECPEDRVLAGDEARLHVEEAELRLHPGCAMVPGAPQPAVHVELELPRAPGRRLASGRRAQTDGAGIQPVRPFGRPATETRIPRWVPADSPELVQREDGTRAVVGAGEQRRGVAAGRAPHGDIGPGRLAPIPRRSRLRGAPGAPHVRPLLRRVPARQERAAGWTSTRHAAAPQQRPRAFIVPSRAASTAARASHEVVLPEAREHRPDAEVKSNPHPWGSED